jgi:hypothetical protein
VNKEETRRDRQKEVKQREEKKGRKWREYTEEIYCERDEKRTRKKKQKKHTHTNKKTNESKPTKHKATNSTRTLSLPSANLCKTTCGSVGATHNQVLLPFKIEALPVAEHSVATHLTNLHPHHTTQFSRELIHDELTGSIGGTIGSKTTK